MRDVKLSIDSTILKMVCVLVETIGDFVGEKCYLSFQPSIPPMYTIPHSLSDRGILEAYHEPMAFSYCDLCFDV